MIGVLGVLGVCVGGLLLLLLGHLVPGALVYTGKRPALARCSWRTLPTTLRDADSTERLLGRLELRGGAVEFERTGGSLLRVQSALCGGVRRGFRVEWIDRVWDAKALGGLGGVVESSRWRLLGIDASRNGVLRVVEVRPVLGVFFRGGECPKVPRARAGSS